MRFIWELVSLFLTSILDCDDQNSFLDLELFQLRAWTRANYDCRRFTRWYYCRESYYYGNNFFSMATLFLDNCSHLCECIYFPISSWCNISERIRYLTLTDASKVWMPDTFFRNEKIGAFHNILTPNLYIRVYPDGDVLYSIRFESFITRIQRIYCNLQENINLCFATVSSEIKFHIKHL